MLPVANDTGARLAAILPTGLASIAASIGANPIDVLDRVYPAGMHTLGSHVDRQSLEDALMQSLPPVRSLVLVVVDGLGQANLKARAGHARTLTSLPTRRIETVTPSTTAAALTTLLTGQLPGQHGLIGYQIRHPKLGVISALKDWDGIADPRAWQRSASLLPLASELGVQPYAVGRAAHATGGLTESILSGATYLDGQTIADRFVAASEKLRIGDPTLMYLYVDELDKVGHDEGWQSEAWLRRLEQFDAALSDFLRTLPRDVGVIVTADHGMIDVAANQQVLLDAHDWWQRDVEALGGEPRMRSLYLRDGVDAPHVVDRLRMSEQGRAWVGTRAEAIAAGWYGAVEPDVAQRLGDVIVAARKQVAYYVSDSGPGALAMVGQHGSLTSEERGVPLALGGSLDGTSFVSAVTQVAGSWVPQD